MNIILAPLLAAATLSGNSILDCVVWLVIAALIFFVIKWGLDTIALPEPFNKLARVLLVLVVVVVLVNALLILAGHPWLTWR